MKINLPHQVGLGGINRRNSFLMDSVFQYLETLKENDHVPVEFHVNLWEHCLIVKRYVVNLLFMP